MIAAMARFTAAVCYDQELNWPSQQYNNGLTAVHLRDTQKKWLIIPRLGVKTSG